MINMEKTIGHDSKEFMVDGGVFLVRPLSSTDAASRKTYNQVLNEENMVALGQLSLSDVPLLDFLKDNDQSYIYIALSEETKDQMEMPVGIAIYLKNAITGSHEISMVVSKKYKNSRVMFELTDSLIKDASKHNVMTVFITGSTDDKNLFALTKKLGMSPRLVSGGKRLVRYSLQVDQHPGVVKL